MRIIGNHVSPYARKVLVALAIKRIAFEIDPIIPFFGTDDFTRLSPLRRIPVLVDGDVTLCDSSVICEYLDEAYPAPPLMPAAPADRARARWLEEYADTRLGDVIIWRLFQERVIKPSVWRTPADETVIATATDQDLPGIMNWLEDEAPAAAFMFGAAPMTVDITFACFFRNAALAGWGPDAARWPRAVAWIARCQEIPEFAATIPIEQLFMTARRADRNRVLRDAGLAIAAETVGGEAPRKGVMPI
ncbi:glutathione S-transferase family protein [Sphingomonas alpina]|uniref:Glutathione S-transferase family protein n=1 Tax=Sphingomonas alpina TaxID=653931 RepID=A0A7H0LKY2_9SPHN|nr:glutathione S-transferase family protein [Sphingomonas alpina]QNQ10335.1 glutathione S-transferase family protein [Sphingomonas alpina]